MCRYSYKKRTSTDDEWLRLYVAEDCEEDWTLRKTMHGNVLSSNVQNSPWIPTSETDWTTVHVTNITSTFFTGGFKFKFNFENDGGNNFYIDNINLYEGSPSDDVIAVGISETNAFDYFSMYPNPTDNELNVEFSLNQSEEVQIIIQDLQGKKIQQHRIEANAGSNIVMFDTNALAPGVYFLNIKTPNGIKTEQFIVK